MEKALFEVFEENLDTGLRGYPVGYCTTSRADPQTGLAYVGKPVSSMKEWKPESVIFLLLNKREGSRAEIEEFSSKLHKIAELKPETVAAIEALPKKGHPMKWLSSALLILGMQEAKADYRKDCIHLIAKIPHLVAVLINAHSGKAKTEKPDPNLGYMENFTHMLHLEGVNKEKLSEALSLFNILHYDHGGGNLSAFVGKAVASGLEDIYGALSASMCALEGVKHGGANQECLQFVQSIKESVGNTPTLENVEKAVRERRARGELIAGFGHAILRVEDPRATIFYDFCKENFIDDPLVKVALLLREAGVKVLKEDPKISNPYPNVDAISGTMLYAAGFKNPDYYTVLFGLSRAVGIAIQIVYDRCTARSGKGTPIVRPKYIYKPAGSEDEKMWKDVF